MTCGRLFSGCVDLPMLQRPEESKRKEMSSTTAVRSPPNARPKRRRQTQNDTLKMLNDVRPQFMKGLTQTFKRMRGGDNTQTAVLHYDRDRHYPGVFEPAPVYFYPVYTAHYPTQQPYVPIGASISPPSSPWSSEPSSPLPTETEVTQQSQRSRKALIFGGTSFMGRSLVERLLKEGEWEITMVNRGRAYWGSNDPFSGRTKRVTCDRENAEEFITICKTLATETDGWDLVIDFSAFRAVDMQMTVDHLRGSVKHYIYISSDSIYMVCRTPADPRPMGRREEDAVRPENVEERQHLNREDSYGDGKLQCEEVLQQANRDHSFPFTSLRLPDVFGPYDNTDRHWKYQLWLSINDFYPIDLSDDASTKRLSFVYSKDVASAVLSVFRAGDKCKGRAYNIACDENPTLEQYLSITSHVMDSDINKKQHATKEVDYSSSSSDASHFSLDSEFLPSVDFGIIDTAAARRDFQWKPTSLTHAIRETVQFFHDAFYRHRREAPLHEFDRNMREAIERVYEEGRKG
ncbi:hypothetical protein PROFUN_01089 [Planoprotostelium fungivorum]|uniref:NAD-dependent epimerase/dehydratase domain-containing protein n=1 Tax=Planoprotostelium fungivorum TaxID=1890364 RepID=A0A2P6NCC8_9EUKA|nr:hypothetical protein PROFUN_01089 [Planoprotostelium fungivorum]